ncbi:hypothetical protein PVAP13_9NG663828 [Panicum virgatum]|uniref:Retrotransposon gag domain-containing protein n=1 Tax=Panicum virgatum TaxID=38727 RepID=A0A8T0MXQ0_PANVG|nr:hypothetical protein PVAP13_9NG663828 [Panicum virgatum]
MAADGEKNSLETTVDEMLTNLTDLAAKVSELATQTAALKPLISLAKQLDGLPDKVTTLQAAAFEGANQIADLSLAVSRLEKAQCGDNDHPTDDAAGATASAPGSLPFRETPHLPHRDAEDDDGDPRFHPRARIEFPTFDGKEDPLPWLNRCETFFRCQNTPERRRVPYASLHLTGSAQLWFYRLELTTGTPLWRRFAQLVQQRFGPPMTDSPIGEIMLLRRDSTVDDYTDKLLALAFATPI